jgi:hypothetical protein
LGVVRSPGEEVGDHEAAGHAAVANQEKPETGVKRLGAGFFYMSCPLR